MSGGSQFQQSVQAFALWAVDHKEIHAVGVGWILKPLHKTGSYKGIQSFRDYLHVASHKGSDLLAGQECPRMLVQKDQQIKVTAVADQRRTSEQPSDLCRIRPLVGRCRNNSLSNRSRKSLIGHGAAGVTPRLDMPIEVYTPSRPRVCAPLTIFRVPDIRLGRHYSEAFLLIQRAVDGIRVTRPISLNSTSFSFLIDRDRH